MTNTNKCFILNKKQNICSLNKKEIDMEKDDKLKALDAALSQIEKQYGKGAVMKLGDPTAQMNVDHPHRFFKFGYSVRTGRYSQGKNH